MQSPEVLLKIISESDEDEEQTIVVFKYAAENFRHLIRWAL